jgi:hypothetical protein
MAKNRNTFLIVGGIGEQGLEPKLTLLWTRPIVSFGKNGSCFKPQLESKFFPFEVHQGRVAEILEWGSPSNVGYDADLA